MATARPNRVRNELSLKKKVEVLRPVHTMCGFHAARVEFQINALQLVSTLAIFNVH